VVICYTKYTPRWGDGEHAAYNIKEAVYIWKAVYLCSMTHSTLQLGERREYMQQIQKQERTGIKVSGSMRFRINYVFNLNSSVLLAEHSGLPNCLFRNANQTFNVKLLLENVGTAYVDSKCSS